MLAAEGKPPKQIRTIQEIAANESRLLEIYKQQRQFSQELQVIEQARANRGNLNDQKRLELLQKIAKAQELVDVLSKVGGPADGAIGARMSLANLKKELEDLDKATKKEGERVVYLNEQLGRLSANETEAADAARELHDELEGQKALDEYYKDLEKLGDESELLGKKLEAGLVTPLEAAKGQLEIIERKMGVILAAGDRAPNGGVFLAQTETERQGAQYEADALAEWERVNGEREKANEKAKKQLEQMGEQLREQWVGIFDQLGQGFSDVFADALVDGKDMAKGLRDVFRDLQKSLIRMVTDTALGGFFRQAGGAFAGTMGATFGAPAPGQAPGQPPSVNINNQQGKSVTSNVSAFSFGNLGAGGNTMMGLASGVGAAAGGYVMNRGVQRSDPTMSAAGGALAGASLGAVFGPVGIVVGALAGAALGWYSGNEAKEEEEKMKERQREMDEAARLEHERMVEKAKGLIKLHVRTNMGGGLATEEAMADVSKLFSGDISAEEVEQFGAENVVARQAEIEQGARSMDIGGISINVNASVSGSYDVQRLAEDLGYHVTRQIQAAAAGAAP
jgi:hypothetical protein